MLKLLPLPKSSVSLLVPFPDMKAAIEAVPKIIRSKVIPTAIEYMSRDTILFSESYLGKKFPDTKNDAYILLTFDGNTDAQVEHDMHTVADLCLDELGALDAYIVDTEERKKAVWSARGAFLEAIKASTTEMDECDVVVPRSRVDEFIKFTHEIAEAEGIRIPSFGHAGDGNLHVYICRDALDKAAWEEKLSRCFDRMYEKAEQLGGLVSGEHGIGYANESGKKFARPFIKYTPTWSRSFMPANQQIRNQVAKMKQIPVPELIKDKKLLLIDDSIVRGTQLRETVDFLYKSGAKEVHMRSACPPIMYSCKYLNFSRGNSDMELLARRVIQELEGDEGHKHLAEYADAKTERGQCMLKSICDKMGFDSLGFQSVEGLIEAIGLDPEKLCTYCWTGKE